MCGLEGKYDSIDLMISYPGALQQVLHTAYEPKEFHPAYNGKYELNRDATLILNHMNKALRICTLFGVLEIPPKSFIIMRGDFVHGGSANIGKVEQKWFFMYFDCGPSYRFGIQNKIYLYRRDLIVTDHHK
jgi:hypothetical protein